MGVQWHGKGEFITKKGDVYSGNFDSDFLIPEGFENYSALKTLIKNENKGKLVFNINNEKVVYEGGLEIISQNEITYSFTRPAFKGLGKLTYEKSGKIKSGIWSNNILIAEGINLDQEIKNLDNIIRKGDVELVKFDNGDVYQGFWENGKFSKKGKLIKKGGDVIEKNDWNEGYPEEYSTLEKFEFDWVNGLHPDQPLDFLEMYLEECTKNQECQKAYKLFEKYNICFNPEGNFKKFGDIPMGKCPQLFLPDSQRSEIDLSKPMY